MSTLQQKRKTIKLMAVLGLLVATMSLSAQPSTLSDADQISSLMAALSNQSKTPGDVLDPSLNPSDRDKNLHRLSAPHYELTIVPTQGVPPVTGDSASVPIRVHFDSKDGNSLDTNATAQFVKRNGRWYFSNFNFMGWPIFLTVVLVACLLVGTGYAATVLMLRSRLGKRGRLGVNGVKMLIPVFWPTLFRQTR